MLDYQQRVIDEKAARDSEIEKLKFFIETNSIFNELPDDEKSRLCRQLILMQELSYVLGERIVAFEKGCK